MKNAILLLIVVLGLNAGGYCNDSPLISPQVISTSADGRFQIRAYYIEPRSDIPSSDGSGIPLFCLKIYDTKDKKDVFDLDGAYDQPHGFDWISNWHPKHNWVAIDEADGRHTGRIEVYSHEGGKWQHMILPEYQANALGRVNGVYCDVSMPTFKRWEGNNLILDYQFHAKKVNNNKPEKCEINHGEYWQTIGDFNCEVTLSIQPSLYEVYLINISTPKKDW